MAQTQHFDKFLTFVYVVGVIWDVSGRFQEVPGNFFNILHVLWMVQKMSGKLQEGPRGPLDPLTKYLVFVQMQLFSHAF